MTRGRPGPGRALVAGLAGALCAALAATGLTTVLEPGTLVPIVVAATVVGVIVGLVVSASRPPVPVRLGIAVLVGVIVAAAVGTRSVDVGAVLAGLRDGPRRLVTGPVPVDDDPATRTVVALILYVVTVTAVALARRGRAAGAVLVTLAGLLVTAAVAPSDRAPSGWVALAWAIVAVTTTAVGATTRRVGTLGTPVERRRVLSGATLLAAGLLVGILVARATSPGLDDRFSLRDVVSEPASPAAVRSPLDSAAQLLTGGDRTLGSASIDDPFADRLPVAVFSDHDGETFTYTPAVAPAGRPLATPEVVEGPQRVVENEIDLRDWPIAALPHTGRARRLAGDDLAGVGFDVAQGRLVRTTDEPLSGRFTIETSVTASPAGATRFAAQATPDGPTVALSDRWDDLLADVEADRRVNPDALTFAEVVADRFRRAFEAAAPGRLSADGASLGQLECLVTGGFAQRGRNECGGEGTRLQVASAYVLALRHHRVPVRLVVGFENLRPGRATPLHAHAITAWAEVDLADHGWVAVDPVDEGGEAEIAPRAVDEPTAAGESGRASSPDVGDGSDRGSNDEARGGDARRLAVPLVVVAAGAVLGAPAAWRWRRRRRRRTGPADERLLGAWWEAHDRVRERGTTLPPGATMTTVWAAAVPGRTALAAAIDAVQFGGAPATPETVHQAWTALDEAESRWRRSASWPTRLRRYWRITRHR